MSTTSLPKPTPYRQKIMARDQAWIDAFRQGATLQEIAASAGLTRQCVALRLKHYGLKRVDGGSHIRTLSRSALRQKIDLERKEAWSARYVGCSRKEFSDTNATLTQHQQTRLIKLYRNTKGRSQREKIPWALSYPDFVHLMKEYIGFYGRGRNKKVLHQIDKTVGYEKNNLEVITLSESSSVKSIGKILTPRQAQIMELYDKGLRTKEIARRLKLKRDGVQLTIHHAKKRRLLAWQIKTPAGAGAA